MRSESIALVSRLDAFGAEFLIIAAKHTMSSPRAAFQPQKLDPLPYAHQNISRRCQMRIKMSVEDARCQDKDCLRQRSVKHVSYFSHACLPSISSQIPL